MTKLRLVLPIDLLPFAWPKNQNEDLFNLLLSGCVATQREALRKLGIMRLSERIRELEAMGCVIEHIPLLVKGRRHPARIMTYKLTGKYC